MAIKSKKNRQVYLAADATLNGLVQSPDAIFIAGTVKGDICSETAIHILRGASVAANLTAPNIQVLGIVEGQITATHELVMNPTARVYGDIHCKSLLLEEGAIYSGTLSIHQTQKKTNTASAE